MIPIYNTPPSDWKDLQKRVAKIFSDMGFTAEIEKDIQLVRGGVNVDVFASRKHVATTETHIVECKLWSMPVPKQVVHSVRTIIADYGANAGYIISQKGFQKGAYEAAENSNLHLLTFQEFQDEFYTRWIESVVDELDAVGYPFRKYTDPMEDFYEENFDELSDEKKHKVRNCMSEYHGISMITSRFNYKSPLSGMLEIDDIDYIVKKNSQSLPIEVNCLMDYFQYLKDLSVTIVKELDSIYGKELRKN